MSLPSSASSARLDPTVRTAAPTRVCPRCRTQWPAAEAPPSCPDDGTALVSPRELAQAEDDAMVGRTLEGRYTIKARLGSGSMGTVYRAKQHAMGREVAIKILRGDRADDETAKARFMREARANSMLVSPNTVTVFDFGQSSTGEFYLAMELLEGESLGQRLTRVGRLPLTVAVDTARQALRSLAEAHAKGIIHRDLKPDNLFFARVVTGARTDEVVKVLDFGIAKVSRDEGAIGVVETQAGTVFGTPRYMSPEQAQGNPLDLRTDLYSLGVILYQMLTGRPPFTDNDAVVVMARHIKSVPKRPSEVCPEANIPRELEDVVLRALAKNPDDRQASADAFATELAAAEAAVSAAASGVRSVSPVRPGDSMPAPVVSAERDRQSGVLVTLLIALVVVVAGVSVFFGMRHLRRPHAAAPPPPAATTAAPVVEDESPPPTIVLPETPAPPPTTVHADPPPASKARGAGRAGARAVKTSQASAAPPPSAAATPSAKPSATASSSYGVFE